MLRISNDLYKNFPSHVSICLSLHDMRYINFSWWLSCSKAGNLKLIFVNNSLRSASLIWQLVTKCSSWSLIPIHGWTRRELRPENCHGLHWWIWNPSSCHTFFTPLTTSSPPLLTTSSGASHEMIPAWCASLQEGPCVMFLGPVRVHHRCTPATITRCSPYRWS